MEHKYRAHCCIYHPRCFELLPEGDVLPFDCHFDRTSNTTVLEAWRVCHRPAKVCDFVEVLSMVAALPDSAARELCGPLVYATRGNRPHAHLHCPCFALLSESDVQPFDCALEAGHGSHDSDAATVVDLWHQCNPVCADADYSGVVVGGVEQPCGAAIRDRCTHARLGSGVSEACPKTCGVCTAACATDAAHTCIAPAIFDASGHCASNKCTALDFGNSSKRCCRATPQTQTPPAQSDSDTLFLGLGADNVMILLGAAGLVALTIILAVVVACRCRGKPSYKSVSGSSSAEEMLPGQVQAAPGRQRERSSSPFSSWVEASARGTTAALPYGTNANPLGSPGGRGGLGPTGGDDEVHLGFDDNVSGYGKSNAAAVDDLRQASMCAMDRHGVACSHASAVDQLVESANQAKRVRGDNGSVNGSVNDLDDDNDDDNDDDVPVVASGPLG